MPVKRTVRVPRVPKKAAAAADATQCLISRLTPENLHDIFRRVEFHARSEPRPQPWLSMHPVHATCAHVVCLFFVAAN